MNNQEELQKAFMSYLIEDAKQQGVTIQSEQDLRAYAENLGEDGLKAKYNEFMQKMQGTSIKAKLGAKLNYLNFLKGKTFLKKGGPMCQNKLNEVQQFKKKRKAMKCGSKIKK